MLISRYSNPEFDPYESDRPVEVEGGPWQAPTASEPLTTTVTLPGSKSLTNRELVLSALADSPSLLRAPLHSRDTELMVQALRALGTDIAEVEGASTGARRFGTDLRVTPAELGGGCYIDCGLAGTVMRFVPPVAALALGPVAFDGDEHARQRPMRTTIEALRGLGVDVNDDGRGRLPFSLYGTGQVEGGTLTIDASASSQFVSGLLLAAPRFTSGLDLRHSGQNLPSLPHIEMTVDVLRQRGVTVHTPEPGHWVVEPGIIRGRTVDIEPDLSNAAPFLVAPLIAGGTVTVPQWPADTTQVGSELIRLLPLFGARVEHADGALRVDGGPGLARGGTIHGVDLDLSMAGELAPALVALAALAQTPSRLTGIGHLRGHETDRLAALAGNLGALGGDVTELDDGLEIRPRTLHGGAWPAFDDHRMATAGAIVGLGVEGVLVDDITTTAKTLPQFPELWRELMFGTAAKATDPLGLI